MPISCFAMNQDGSMVAFSPNNNEVHIAEVKEGAFNVLHVLSEHDQKVTFVDWAPKTNRILTCSEDRNAYVWDFSDTWKPTLVLLRINRAATYAKWSNNETKFAVASGQKCVAICYYEEESNWWVSKLVEGFESTVLTVSWHASDIAFAAGSSDGTVRLFTAAVKGVDSKPSQIFGPDVSFKKMGTEICVIQTNAWVQDMAFSPSSEVLAYATHDSSVHFLSVPSGAAPSQEGVQSVRCSGLPHRRVLFLAEDTLVAGGHDNNPTLYCLRGGKWAEGKKLDSGTSVKKESSASSSARSAAFKKFEMSSSQGIDDKNPEADAVLTTVHQNAISGLGTCAAWKEGGRSSKVVSVGLDGRLCSWPVPSLEEAMAGLSIGAQV